MDIAKFKDKLAGASEYLTDLKEEGKLKFVNYVNGLSDIIPIIAETGYRLKGMDVEVSLPPSVEMHFEKYKNISEEKINQILEANKDKDLLIAIVRALVSADAFHEKLKLGNLLLTDISVSLGLPPKVTIKFNNKEG